MQQALLFLATSRGWFFSHTPHAGDVGVHYHAGEDALLFSLPAAASGGFFELSGSILRKISASLFFQSGERMYADLDLASPLVDRKILEVEEGFLRNAARRGVPFIKKCHWWGGAPYAIALTHDVDLTRLFGWKSILAALATGRWKTGGDRVRKKISRENPYWTFPQLLSLYEKSGWSATFFFLSRPWEGFSYRYNISRPRFRQLLRQLNERGHEVGLHSSLRASGNPKFIAQEKRRLEQILRAAVPGVRQHFLRLSFPQAWEHFATTGFSYDSSSGFNEKPGFKSGTAFPYSTIDVGGSQALPLVEIPFQIMDYALVRGTPSPDEAWHLFSRIGNEVKATGGILNILWHPSNLVEREYLQVWERITDWISEEHLHPETLARLHTRWNHIRHLELISYRRKGEHLELVLSSPHSIPSFCLEVDLPVGTRLVISERFKVQRISDQRFLVEIDNLAAGETKVSLRISRPTYARQ